MPTFAKFWLLTITAATLIGCQHDDKQQDRSGVYQGIWWNEAQIPQQMDIIINAEQRPLLLIWDEREHQQSYLGNQSGSNVEFTSLNIECQFQALELHCETANGNVTMRPSKGSASTLGDFTGVYQARIDDDLYQMQIQNSGTFTINSDNCQTQGQLRLLEELSLAQFVLSDSQCFDASSVSYANMHIDNGSLYSLELSTNADGLAEVWVRDQ